MDDFNTGQVIGLNESELQEVIDQTAEDSRIDKVIAFYLVNFFTIYGFEIFLIVLALSLSVRDNVLGIFYVIIVGFFIAFDLSKKFSKGTKFR